MWLLIRFDQSWGYYLLHLFKNHLDLLSIETSVFLPSSNLLNIVPKFLKSQIRKSHLFKHSTFKCWSCFAVSKWFAEKGNRTTQDWSLCSSHRPKTETVVSLPLCVCCLSLYFSPFRSSSPLTPPPLLCEQLPHVLSLAPCWCVVGNIRWLLGK